MFGKSFQRRYALTERGASNIKKGMAWTIVVDLLVMGGISILYLLMRAYMNTLLSGADLPKTLPYLSATVLFLILSLFTHYQQYHATYGLVYGEVRDVRIGLAEQLRKLPLAFFGKRDLSDLSETIMSDVSRLEHVWSHVLGYLYGSYVSTAVIAVGLFLQDWRLALACLWGVPVAFTLLFGGRMISKRASRRTKDAALRVSDSIQEMLETIREIRSNGMEEEVRAKFERRVDQHEATMRRGEFVLGLFVNAAAIVMRLGIATTILVGANLILSGQIDFMKLFLFMLVISRVYAPFDQSLALIAELFISDVSAQRLMAIHDMPAATGASTFAPGNHDIRFEHVSFSYDREEVLHEVSFTAKEGEVTAFVGPSGSGKSTCIRLAARLWEATKGTVRVGEVPIASVDPEVLWSHYSMVFQDVVLFDDTILENIRLGRRDASDEEVLVAARAANCDEFVEKLPQGYQSQIGENGARLSGGERQRISIARALLKDAPIVLLDEATASLDVENESKIQEALSRLLAGKTVLVIAHRMRTIEQADHLIVLDQGRIIESGCPQDLLAKEDGLFKRLHTIQAESAGWTLQSKCANKMDGDNKKRGKCGTEKAIESSVNI